MDIFQYRDDLIGDYSSYVKGFLEVQDTEVEQFITSRLDGGSFGLSRSYNSIPRSSKVRRSMSWLTRSASMPHAEKSSGATRLLSIL
jgi:hypothetical protein